MMEKIKKLFPRELKNFYHRIMALIANVFYGFPGKRIKIIGVTGTNGKTTTTQMIGKVLEEGGFKVALSSTISFQIGEKKQVNMTKYTTLSSFAVQKFLHQAVEADCQYVVLEISSHALDQNRIWGFDCEIAVVTNVTREHLDYHKTMTAYREAKRKMFRRAKKAVVNLDMKRPEDFFEFENEEKFGYTCRTDWQNWKLKDEKIKIFLAEQIENKIDSSVFRIAEQEFNLFLPGQFNIENALAAVCVGSAEGLTLREISEALKDFGGVSGRMEEIPNDKNLKIIIDYAVTPDSLEKIYSFLRKNNFGRKIIAVFGSCGDRDRGKRPIMGKIVSGYADYVIITNEDPYFENPKNIIEEVAIGVKNKEEGKNFFKIFDRREAISKALRLAQRGDLVVVTGKGAEETMAIGKERLPWNDKKVVLEELKKI